MPAFTIGVGDIQSAGEHGTPAGTLPSDRPFALDLCRSLIDAGIDIAFSDRIAIDHGISHAFPWVIGEDTPIPIVPIVVNCFAPPLPRLSRVVAVCPALPEAIAALRDGTRVALGGNRGPPHRPTLTDQRTPGG